MEPLGETVGSVCTSQQAPEGRTKMLIKAQGLPDSSSPAQGYYTTAPPGFACPI